MSTSPSEADMERAARTFMAATKISHEEAGAADEESFDIGKNLGICLAEAQKACRNLASFHEHLKERREQTDKMLEQSRQLLSPNADMSTLAEAMQALDRLFAQDGEFLHAQFKLYKEDLMKSSDELASILEESEDRTKDEN